MIRWTQKDYDKIYNRIVKDDYTIREVANEFHVSRSTIHQLIHNHRFEQYCIIVYDYSKLLEILDKHFKFKHYNGGYSTAKMWGKRK